MADNDGNGGTSLWVPAGLPGGKTPPPEAITTTADPDFFPALSLFPLEFPSLTLNLVHWGQETTQVKAFCFSFL